MPHREVRVHGVSGTPPEQLLYTRPVATDLRGSTHTKVFHTEKDPEFTVRAFHWGSLTSGHWSTAFWILLAPFAFANVAGWKRSPGTVKRSTPTSTTDYPKASSNRPTPKSGCSPVSRSASAAPNLSSLSHYSP